MLDIDELKSIGASERFIYAVEKDLLLLHIFNNK